MARWGRKDPTTLVDEIFAALKAQTVTVPVATAAEPAIPQLAANIKALLEQRKTIARQVEDLLAVFPFVLGRDAQAGSILQDRSQPIPQASGIAPIRGRPVTWRPQPASPRSPDDPVCLSRVRSPPDRRTSG